ncbi:MAG TPA: hypothetical protein VF898_06405 [Chloroflexota bacterium]
MLPAALVISNYPIIAMTAAHVLKGRYRLLESSWHSLQETSHEKADLVIVDVTTVDTITAMSALTQALPGARIVVCSLHENQVQVYRHTESGLRPERSLPSLLALAH